MNYKYHLKFIVQTCSFDLPKRGNSKLLLKYTRIFEEGGE